MNSPHSQNFLSVPEIFTYEFFQSNRYTISEKDNLEALCNNGFIKLYTPKTRVYWHAQNQLEHRVADWKFHISVAHTDLRKAWNLLVGLFIRMRCRAGMKVVYLKQAEAPQPGREITLYIYKYDKMFEDSAFAPDFDISIADEHSEGYWYELAVEIQSLLNEHQISPNGLAEGDKKVGKYLSLRNEAYTLVEDGTYKYPPNSKGWNAEMHPLPFALQPLVQRIRLEVTHENECVEKIKQAPMYYFALPIMIISAGLLVAKKFHDLG